MKMRLTIVSIMILLVVGCLVCVGSGNAASDHWPVDYGTKYNNYKVQIISDPPGAVIEWDNEYIGKAPLTHSVSRKIGFLAQWTVTATPTYPGGCKQIKYLDGQGRIPRKMYFNTNLCSR